MARDTGRGLKSAPSKHKDRGVPEVQEEEVSSFKKIINTYKEKFKLGPHHKMERFSVLLGSTLVMLLMFTTVAFANYRSDVANLASSQTILTKDFTFSLSQEKGSVVGVYGNAEKTDVMVLLKFASPHNMSANAENYQVFITGLNRPLKHEPDVSFSMFGATGYAMVRFQDDKPLRKEPLDITIRAKSRLSASDGKTNGDVTDGSFQKYDQAKFYVNVGAENVTVLEGITPGETDPTKLYIAMVAEAEDLKIKEEINTQTKELQAILNRITEYEGRLTLGGYIVPNRPWFIQGDTVDENGVFKPMSHLKKTHDFDYWSKTIWDGYVGQVISDMSEFESYMAEKNATFTAEDRNDPRPEKVEPIKLLEHKDGGQLDLTKVQENISSSAQISAKQSVEELQKNWSSYLNLKGTLQRTSLQKLLVLDADVLSQRIGFTTTSGENAIFFY